MTGCVNKVILVGAVGKEGVAMSFHPTTGTPKAALTLILTEQGPDGHPYSRKVPVEIWGRHAEAVSALSPGTLVAFDGKVGRRSKAEGGDLVMSGFDLTPLILQAEAVAS